MSEITIVLAEDNKLIRAGLKSVFDDSEGFKIIGEAENGMTAVSKVLQNKPDVLLLDLGLPDISGIEVIKQLKENGSETKIIVLTGRQDENEISECISLGIFAYVLKDISSDMLLNIVKDVHSGSVRFSPAAASVLRNESAPSIPLKQNMTRAEFRNRHANLTQREFEVLKLIVDGKSNNDIADELCISPHTAKAHVCSIIQKLVVDDRTQAAVKALKEGIVR